MKRISVLFAAVTFAAALLVSASLGAQPNDRSFIRNSIREHGECKNVAITKTNGDAMIYGRNGWAADGCPRAMTNALHKLNEDNEVINDIQLTENGSWLILYGDNGIWWDGIPTSLENKLRKFNNDNEEITSVSFNDYGDWIVVTKNYISSSDSDIQDWIVGGMDKYGAVWATCLTNNAIVVVYEDGYRFRGEVPQTLKDKLVETSINVYRVKIAGTSWFFSDNKSCYQYSM